MHVLTRLRGCRDAGRLRADMLQAAWHAVRHNGGALLGRAGTGGELEWLQAPDSYGPPNARRRTNCD